MAESETEITNHMTNCSVCFESYAAKGRVLPRILPCFHTFCDRCINDLMKKDKFRCPECKVSHAATSGAKSFKINKYVLSHLETVGNESMNKTSKSLKEEEFKNLLLESANSDIDVLTQKLEQLRTFKTEMKEKNEACLQRIDQTKDVIVAKMNKMKEDVRKATKFEALELSIKIGEVEETLMKVKDIKDKLENDKMVNVNELALEQQSLGRACKGPVETYKYCIYTPCNTESSSSHGYLMTDVQDKPKSKLLLFHCSLVLVAASDPG